MRDKQKQNRRYSGLSLLFALCLVLAASPVRADWEEMVGPTPIWEAKDDSHLHREHAWALKAGYRFASPNSYSRAWKMDWTDLQTWNIEASYERVFWKYLGLELGAGYWGLEKKSTDTFFQTDISKLDLKNVYLSPTIKGILPLTNHWVVYAGGGADLYYSWAEQTYIYGLTGKTRVKSQRLIPGWHVTGGTEFFIMPDPGGRGTYNWPVGLFIEYKYSEAVWPNLDKDIIGKAGRTSNHDFQLGGHQVFCGLRFHI